MESYLNEINQLNEKSPFDQAIIVKLEYVLTIQLSNQLYNFNANKLLVKNYQIYPQNVKIDILCNVLILSLMRLPNTDFLALIYMIPVTYISHPSIKHIYTRFELLEKGLYNDFWLEYSSVPAGLYSQANGFVGAIRSFILSNLSNTFKNIDVSLFCEYLGLPESEINLFVKSSPIPLEIISDKVLITSDTTNLPVQKFEETFRMEEVLKIVDSIRAISK